MPGWVTVPLGQMYNPVFFIGTAYAIDGDTDVPLQPVSHGCVRIPMDIAAFFHTLVKAPGTPAYVYNWTSRPPLERGISHVAPRAYDRRRYWESGRRGLPHP